MQKHRKLQLCGCFLALTLLFSGCNEAFSENPVVQSIASGNPYVDLTRNQVDALFDEHSVKLPPKDDKIALSDRDRLAFYSFLKDIKQSDTIRYCRSMRFKEPVSLSEPQEKLLTQEVLEVVETKNAFAMQSKSGKGILHNQQNNYLIDTEKKDPEKVSLSGWVTQDLFFVLANKEITPLAAVDKELDGTIVKVYTVQEGNHQSLWYFNPKGTLFYRALKDESTQIPYGVQYENLDFSAPVEKSFFTIENQLDIIKNEKSDSSDKLIDPKEKTDQEEKEKLEKENKEKETQKKAEEDKKQQEIQKAEKEKKAQEEQEKAKKEAVSSKEEPKENKTATTPKETPASPPDETSKTEKFTPKPLPDYSQSTSSKVESSQTEPPKKAPSIIEIKPDEPEIKEPENSGLPKYFPDSIPIISGTVITTSNSTIVSDQRNMYVTGDLPSSFISSVDFYNKAFRDVSNNNYREMHDESTNETYGIFTGTTEGWSYNVQIISSNVDASCSIRIHLIK